MTFPWSGGATGRSVGDCLSNEKNERFLDRGYQGRGGYWVILGNSCNRIVRAIWFVLPSHRQIKKELLSNLVFKD